MFHSFSKKVFALYRFLELDGGPNATIHKEKIEVFSRSFQKKMHDPYSDYFFSSAQPINSKRELITVHIPTSNLTDLATCLNNQSQ